MSSLRTMTAVDALYVACLVCTIIAFDVVFFRHHFFPRLAFNVGTVLIYLAFYFRYLHHAPTQQSAPTD